MPSRLLQDLKSQVLLGFGARKNFYSLCVVSALLLYWLPYLGIVVPRNFVIPLALVLSLPMAGSTFFAGRFFGKQLLFGLRCWMYDRVHKPEESLDPDLLRIAQSIGVNYDKPIYITDNAIVEGPYTDAMRGIITFPRSWTNKYMRELFLAGGTHELAHIKYKNQFGRELLLAGAGTALFSYSLSTRLAMPVVMFAEMGFLMLAFTLVSHRNELRADRLAKEVMGEDAIASLLEDLGRTYGFDVVSETHPSIKYRIDSLMR